MEEASTSGSVAAYVEIRPMYKLPLTHGELVRFDVRTDDQFHIIHPVHGKIYTLWEKEAPRLLVQFMDEGHIVMMLDAVKVEQVTSDESTLVDIGLTLIHAHLWLEIRIKRESLEMVSTRLYREGRWNAFLSIRPGGFNDLNCVYAQVFDKWKASKQCLLEYSNAASGCGVSPPADVIKSELYDHQKQGLMWMIGREQFPDDDDDGLPPFWEERDGVYRAELSSLITLKPPHKLRGGILADESGMGKNLTVLSLIAYTKKINYQDGDAATCHLRKKPKLDIEADHWKPTLVVCPPSILGSWKRQIEQFTWPGSLKVCIYHGKSKSSDPELLRQHDLVLTTYSILVKEEESGSRIINQIDWWRIVLDDAHVLKSTNPRANAPFINLKAKCRWALTGKPVHHDYHNYNLFPIMAFLQIQPFCDKVDWGLIVAADLRHKRVHNLKILMDIFSLQRSMPVRFIENYLVVMSKDEQAVYNSMEFEAKRKIVHKDGLRSLQAAVLHLWQSCNSLALCRLSCAEMVSSTDFKDLNGNRKLLEKWIAALQEENDYACPVCMDQPEDSVITRCAHLFCKSCITRLFDKPKRKKLSCPLCRRRLSKNDIYSAQIGPSVVDKMKFELEVGSSSSSANIPSKVAAVLSLLQKSRKEDPNRKSVVFSQFRRMLRLVSGVLSESGFNVRILDVNDSGKTKAKIVEDLSNSDVPVVLVCSFKALCNNTLSLDLSAASNVYMMEPCWNAHTEQEALSRIRRVGKKEDDVSVIRLVSKNSIEERALEMRNQSVTYGTSNSKWEINISDIRILEKLAWP